MLTFQSLASFVLACLLLSVTGDALRATLLHEGHHSTWNPRGNEQAVPIGTAAIDASTANHQQQQQQQQRSLLQVPIGGVGGGAAAIGPIVNAVAQGIDIGLDIMAPAVNAVASHVPVILPSLNGFCMNGEPITPFRERPELVFCLVGNGAQVTNFLFDTTTRLTGLAGNIAGGGGLGRR